MKAETVELPPPDGSRPEGAGPSSRRALPISSGQFGDQSPTAGARFMLLAQIARAAIHFVGLAILARLLTPADFGVTAIVIAVMSVAGVLGDLGLSLAAIRERTLTQPQWSALFWLNAAFGLFLALAVIGAALVVPDVLGDDRLTAYLVAVAPVFVLNGCSVQYRVQLTRDRRFGALGAIETVAPALALAIAVGLALMSPGPWPLILQQILGPAVLLALAVATVRRAPGWPRRGARIRRMVLLGGAQSIAGVLNAASESLGPLALGRGAPDALLGAYSRGKQLALMPHTQLASSLTRAVLPSLASAGVVREFELRLLRARASYGYTVGVLTALLGGFAAPIVGILLGSQWIDHTPRLISIFTLGMLLQCVTYVFYWGLVATAKTRLLMLLEAPVLSLIIVAVVVTASHGPEAMAWTYTVGTAIRAVVAIIWATPGLGMSRKRYLASAIPNVAVLVLIQAGGLTLVSVTAWLPNAILLLMGLAWAGLVLFAAGRISSIVKEDLDHTISIVLRIAGLRRPSHVTEGGSHESGMADVRS